MTEVKKATQSASGKKKTTGKKAPSARKTASKATRKKTPAKKAATKKKAVTKKKAARKTAARKAGRRRLTPEQRYRLVAEAAFLRAESRGFVGGDPVEDWLAAEQEVDDSHTG